MLHVAVLTIFVQIVLINASRNDTSLRTLKNFAKLTQSSSLSLFNLENSLREPPKYGGYTVINSSSPEIASLCATDTEILRRLLNNGYSKHRVPQDGVVIDVEFWIQEISAISELHNDFEMDIYVNELWYDHSLSFSKMKSCKDNITLDHVSLQKVWMPNNCFITTKQAEIHDSPFKNVFFTLFKNGTVWVNYRVKVRGPCQMDLSQFPMDVQNCSLIYLSFNYNNEAVRLHWNSKNENPVYALGKIMLPDYELIKIIPQQGKINYPAGYWDTLLVTFTFKRRYAWYFLHAFLPTYLTIFISWIAFSLSPRAIPARTLLGINAILAQILQFGSLRSMLPRVSYMKAIDVWILVSMFFVFASLVELAIISYYAKCSDETKKDILTHDDFSDHPMIHKTSMIEYIHPIANPNTQIIATNLTHFTKMQRIDFYAKIFFPAFYSLFNIFFWSYYTL